MFCEKNYPILYKQYEIMVVELFLEAYGDGMALK